MLAIDKVECDIEASDPGWYRRLSNSEREALNGRFWEEGRLKLEPWLGPRVHRDEITIRPRTSIVGSQSNGGSLYAGRFRMNLPLLSPSASC